MYLFKHTIAWDQCLSVVPSRFADDPCIFLGHLTGIPVSISIRAIDECLYQLFDFDFQLRKADAH